MGFFGSNKSNSYRNKSKTSTQRSVFKPLGTNLFQQKLNDIQSRIDSETDWFKMYDHWHDKIHLVGQEMGKKVLKNDFASLKWVSKVFSHKIYPICKNDDEALMNYGTMMGAYIGVVLIRGYQRSWNDDKDTSPSKFNTLFLRDDTSFDIFHATIDWSHDMKEEQLNQHLRFLFDTINRA